MSSVRYDSYTRGSQRRRSDAVSGLHFLLMFVAAGLLALTRVEHPVVADLQNVGRDILQPVQSYIRRMAEPIRNASQNAVRSFTVESELRQLERELASLRQLLKQTSALAKRNEELARLVKLVETAPVSAVTVEVIAGPRGLFTKSVQIGAGRGDGLRYGQPVFSGDGLFGRIVGVGENTAAVLMLNDINSRIPVEIGDAKWPALLVGDHSDLPRLVYLNAGVVVKNGDAVVTSGASGEFPRGIEVGVVVAGADDVRVKTAASLVAGAYLTVLRYDLPTAGDPSGASTEGEGKVAGAAQRRRKR